jgi:phage recombination protein Bet
MSNLAKIVSDERGISIEVWSALKNSIFPGASDESVVMAWDYCAARGLDVMLKPVHLVPMYVKDKNNGDKGAMRDVVMPGIGLYRIQADRAGNYAGMSAPKFGPDITAKLSGVDISYPEWCEVSVSKLIGDRLVEFTDRQYWLENYATAGRDSQAPNAMWLKRPRAQLVKCTEAQVLRKAWPELGAQPTAEEMEGKVMERDITPHKQEPQKREAAELPEYPQQRFERSFPKWKAEGKNANEIIEMVSTAYILTDEQKRQIREIDTAETGESQ